LAAYWGSLGAWIAAVAVDEALVVVVQEGEMIHSVVVHHIEAVGQEEDHVDQVVLVAPQSVVEEVIVPLGRLEYILGLDPTVFLDSWEEKAGLIGCMEVGHRSRCCFQRLLQQLFLLIAIYLYFLHLWIVQPPLHWSQLDLEPTQPLLSSYYRNLGVLSRYCLRPPGLRMGHCPEKRAAQHPEVAEADSPARKDSDHRTLDRIDQVLVDTNHVDHVVDIASGNTGVRLVVVEAKVYWHGVDLAVPLEDVDSAERRYSWVVDSLLALAFPMVLCSKHNRMVVLAFASEVLCDAVPEPCVHPTVLASKVARQSSSVVAIPIERTVLAAVVEVVFAVVGYQIRSFWLQVLL